jgi:hypothetical protein
MRSTFAPLILALAVLVGCAASPSSKIIGKWSPAGHSEVVWSFADNGSLTTKDGGTTAVPIPFKLSEDATSLEVTPDGHPYESPLVWLNANTFTYQAPNGFGTTTVEFHRI